MKKLDLIIIMIILSNVLFAQQWSTPQTVMAGAYDNFALTVDHNNHIHLVFQNNLHSDQKGYLQNQYTYYNGLEWQSPEYLGGYDSRSSSISVNNENNLSCVWAQGPSFDERDLYYSTNQGSGWAQPKIIFNSRTTSFFPQLYIPNNDTVYIAWLHGNNDNWTGKAGDIYWGKIIDEEVKDTVNISGQNLGGQCISVFDDKNGRMNIIWETFRDFFPTQYYAVKTDTGWSQPDSIGTGNITQARIDRNGIIHMIYYYIPDVGDPDIFYRNHENQSWSEPIMVSVTHNESSGFHASDLTIDSRNRVFVAWIERYGNSMNNMRSKIFFTYQYHNRWIPHQEITDCHNPEGPVKIAVDGENTLHLIWNDDDFIKHIYTKIDTTRPDITITSPQYNANIAKNTEITIQWGVSDEHSIIETLLYFSSDSGLNWTLIDSLSYNTTSYSWYLPDIVSDNCMIKIKAIDSWLNEQSATSSPFRITNYGIPKKFYLHQNYPNPFNAGTTITYEIPHTSFVNLTIYDILGRKITTLVNEIQAADYHTLKVESTNLAAGIYFYTLRLNNDFNKTRKMLYLP